MTKQELRILYKEKRNSLSDTKAEYLNELILKQLKDFQIWNFTNYHIFVPIEKNKEVNTFPIIDYLLSMNKKVFVPKTIGLKMQTCQINQSTVWENGQFEIPEPKICIAAEPRCIEVIFIPMLICDKKGNRIGYGGGFYDRFLENLNPNVLKIGLNYFPSIENIEEIEATDVPIDYCVSPEGIESFGI